mmetsp:Transcript_60121/g.135288  ORF Transcript_60121/g.135288 Transcript_60121/m.135288 type:complete len:81 (+) Transcript_60121:2-244(+)
MVSTVELKQLNHDSLLTMSTPAMLHEQKGEGCCCRHHSSKIPAPYSTISDNTYAPAKCSRGFGALDAVMHRSADCLIILW